MINVDRVEENGRDDDGEGREADTQLYAKYATQHSTVVIRGDS